MPERAAAQAPGTGARRGAGTPAPDERPRARGLLLDLDGTLADTAPDLTSALNRALVANGYPPVAGAPLRSHISGGGRAMIEFALGLRTPEPERDRVRHAFLDHYLAHVCEQTRLYPGMGELLSAADAAGLPWGIVTNKLTRYTLPLIDALGLADRAACVICGDTLARSKPHPEPLLEAARRCGRDAGECVYVGDHLRDIEAGRAAGMRTLAARFGYLDAGEDVLAWGADACIEEAGAIADWLELEPATRP